MATDCDREGQLIGQEILEHLRYRGHVRRALFTAQDPKSLRQAFDKLKPNKRPRRGDILYTVTGSFGIPVIVNEDKEFCFQRHVGLIRPNSQTSTRWLYYLLMSPNVVAQAVEGATGTAQKTVSLKVLRAFAVPTVRTKAQVDIANALDALALETDRLQSIYERKLVSFP